MATALIFCTHFDRAKSSGTLVDPLTKRALVLRKNRRDFLHVDARHRYDVGTVCHRCACADFIVELHDDLAGEW